MSDNAPEGGRKRPLKREQKRDPIIDFHLHLLSPFSFNFKGRVKPPLSKVVGTNPIEYKQSVTMGMEYGRLVGQGEWWEGEQRLAITSAQ